MEKDHKRTAPAFSGSVRLSAQERNLAKKTGIYFLARSGIIAALYTVLTMLTAPIGFGPIQFRISEALAVLPYYDPAAIPGVFIGCLLSNLLGGNGIWDVVLGSLTTLIAAFLTYKLKNKYVALVPPVVLNGLVIGTMLHFLLNAPWLETMATITLGQVAACYGLGLLLMVLLEKRGLYSPKNVQKINKNGI